KRHSLRSPQLGKDPGLYRCRRAHTGVGDRREYCYFQRGRKGSAPAPSLSAPGESGGDLKPLSATTPSRRIVSRRLRRLASASYQLFGDGSLCEKFKRPQLDGRWG